MDETPAVVLPGVRTYLVLMIWVTLAVVVAAAGALETGPQKIPFALVGAVLAPVLVFALLYKGSPAFRDYILRFDFRLVVIVQAWRVVGAGMLFVYAFDELPAAFAVPAGLGDIFVGVTAPAVAMALLGGGLTKQRFVTWSALGILDFVVALTAGAISRPDAMESLPVVLFPIVAVPFFFMVHLIGLLQVRHRGWTVILDRGPAGGVGVRATRKGSRRATAATSTVSHP
jgi:hypothetical protein